MITQTAPRPEGNFFPATQCRVPTTSAPMPSRAAALQCREVPDPECRMPSRRFSSSECRDEQGIRLLYICIDFSNGDQPAVPVENKALGFGKKSICRFWMTGGLALFPDKALGFRRKIETTPHWEELGTKSSVYTHRH